MKYAIFDKGRAYLFDIQAGSEAEALAKAKLDEPDAEIAILVVPGGDLGVNGVH